MEIKMILFLVVSCLALNSGMGAPSTAAYNFVRCNPKGSQANCVTYKSPVMEWSEDLPRKLPPSTAQYLEAEPVEGEGQPTEESEVEEGMEKEERLMRAQEGESPMDYIPTEGSGGDEGSAYESPFMVDRAGEAAESGRGFFKTMKLFPSSSSLGEPKPAEKELKEDQLLQL